MYRYSYVHPIKIDHFAEKYCIFCKVHFFAFTLLFIWVWFVLWYYPHKIKKQKHFATHYLFWVLLLKRFRFYFISYHQIHKCNTRLIWMANIFIWQHIRWTTGLFLLKVTLDIENWDILLKFDIYIKNCVFDKMCHRIVTHPLTSSDF